jgi:hypothetical protein
MRFAFRALPAAGGGTLTPWKDWQMRRWNAFSIPARYGPG